MEEVAAKAPGPGAKPAQEHEQGQHKRKEEGPQEEASNELARGELLKPRMIRFDDRVDFEVSVHETPRSLLRDVAAVFRDAIEQRGVRSSDIKIVPTIQRTRLNILMINEATAQEKDTCLEDFDALARSVCKAVEAAGFWADFCDPCSGLPMFSGGNVVYSEIQGLEKVRRFHTTNAGCCRVAVHPLWGPNMYPATLFTDAPVEVIAAALGSVATTES